MLKNNHYLNILWMANFLTEINALNIIEKITLTWKIRKCILYQWISYIKYYILHTHTLKNFIQATKGFTQILQRFHFAHELAEEFKATANLF